MREVFRVLAFALVLGVAVAGCSGGGDDAARQDDEGTAAGGRTGARTSRSERSTQENGLGHQAYMQPTRLVVPASVGDPLDRVARMAAGLTESSLGTTIFVDQQPGQRGLLAWRDIAKQEPNGHQLAYVTEGLLTTDEAKSGLGVGDFELVAQIDAGSAVLVVRKDPEAESFQVSIDNLEGFIGAAKEEPGLVEVADLGPDTVYRAGTRALEREAGIDLSPKSPGKKAPIEAIYDGDVEAALVPAEGDVLTDIWAGELRAIAVLGEERSEDLPNVPTARELGYDVSVPVFGGIAVPAGTSPEEVAKLGRKFEASSSARMFARALIGTGRRPVQRGPEEFASFVEEQGRLLSEAESGDSR